MKWLYKCLMISFVAIASLLLYVQQTDSSPGVNKIDVNVKRIDNTVSLAANNNSMTDVRSFGAKGDGVTDDTEAIQNAINCGGTVLFTDGTYIVDSQLHNTVATDRGTIEQPDGDSSVCGIIISKPCIIICKNATIKTKENAKAALGNSYLFAVNAEGVTFSGVVLDGNRYNAEHSYGIQINASNCVIKDCVANRFDGSPLVINGLPLNYVNNIKINNFYAENVGNTIFATFSKYNLLNGIKSVNSSEGIDFDKLVSDTNIVDCYFEGGNRTKADAGIEINGGKNININKVVAINYRPALLLNGKKIDGNYERTQNITISNITSINSLGNGITIGNVFKQGDDIDSCSFSNITIIRPTYFGIQLRGTNCQYKNVLIQGANQAGIYSVNGARNISVSGIIKDCKKDGIHLSNTTNFLIENAEIIENNKGKNNYNGILLDGNNFGIKVSNVIITGEHQNGIRSKGVNNISMLNCKVNKSLHNRNYLFSRETTSDLYDNVKRIADGNGE